MARSTNIHSPRRIAATIVIFLVAGGGGGALVGMAAASDLAMAEGQPFAVAMPREGDAGRYELEKADLTEGAVRRGFQPDRELMYSFAVEPGQATYRQTGEAVWVWPFTVNRTDEGGGTLARHLFDAQTREPVSSTMTRIDRHEPVQREGLVDEESRHSTTWISTAFEPGQDIPCGLLDPLQGVELPPIDVVHPDLTVCDWGPNSLDSQNRFHVVVRGVTASDPPLLVVDHHKTHPDDVPRATDRPDWRAWYAADVPYPVRMLDLAGGNFGAPGDALILSGFDRGTRDLLATPGKPLLGLPPLDHRPLGPLTLEEGALVHPWKLSQAVAYARSDPTDSRLRDFLAAHPEAYLAFARHAAFDMDGRSERWEFAFVDGDEHLHTMISRREAPGIGGLLDGGYHYTYQDGGEWLEDATFPPKERLPETLPTAASMLAQWRLVGAGTAHPNASESYEFWLLCADETCDELDVRVGAGSAFYYHLGSFPMAREQTWHESTLFFGEGGLDSLQQSLQVSITESDAPIPPLGGADTPPVTGADLSAVRPPPWGWPSPAAALGVGAGAFLLALLYYLSPLAKGGALGLFSRVRDDQVLAQPQRRRIMEAVQAHPGIHVNEIRRATGQHNGAVVHHLRKLEQSCLVTRSRQGGYTCYFPRGGVDRRVMAGAAVLKSAGARKVLAATNEVPGCALSEVAQAAGIRPQSAHYHVRRLEEAGLVTTRKQQGRLCISATPVAAQAMGTPD